MDPSTIVLLASLLLVAVGAALGIEVNHGDALLVVQHVWAAVLELLGLLGIGYSTGVKVKKNNPNLR